MCRTHTHTYRYFKYLKHVNYLRQIELQLYKHSSHSTAQFKVHPNYTSTRPQCRGMLLEVSMYNDTYKSMYMYIIWCGHVHCIYLFGVYMYIVYTYSCMFYIWPRTVSTATYTAPLSSLLTMPANTKYTANIMGYNMVDWMYTCSVRVHFLWCEWDM